MSTSLALQLHNHPNLPGNGLALLSDAAGRPGAVAVLFASQLILGVPGARTEAIDEIHVADALGASRILRRWLILDHLAGAAEDRSASPYTLVVLPLADLAGLDLAARLKIGFRSGGSRQVDVFARPEALRLDGGDENGLPLGFVAAVAESGGLDPRAAAIFGPAVVRMEPGETTRTRLLRAHRTPHALVVEGIVENLALRNLALATRDLSVLVPMEEMILRVSEETSAGADEDDGDEPGEPLAGGGTLVRHFTAVFGRALRGAEEIVLLELRHGELLVSEPMPVPVGRMSTPALSVFIDGLGEDAAIEPERAAAVLSPLLAVPASAAVPMRHRFGPEGVEPRISVVVALSGEELFLRSLLAQQKPLPQAMEWILCAERTPASAGFLQLLSSMSGRLARPTTLILLDSLCGPVRLKNLGVEASRAEAVAFLDEAAWVEDAEPWLVALREIRERRFDIVGIGSHFSDGTLDNEGLLRSRARGNPSLQRVDFRRRGFPPPQAGFRMTVEPVEAASSAAMLTSRARFQTIGGFDEAFALPDFADLDLSLRAGRSGASVGFVRGRGAVRGRGGAELGHMTARAKACALLDGARLALNYPLAAARQEAAW